MMELRYKIPSRKKRCTMSALEFSSPRDFIKFFISNNDLHIPPGEKLVIKHAKLLILNDFWDHAIPALLNIDPTLYFLNRIIVPLGKCLAEEGADQTPLELTVGEDQIEVSKQTPTTLHLRKGPIIASISDLIVRMMHSQIRFLSIEPGQNVTLVVPEGTPLRKEGSVIDSITAILGRFIPKGLVHTCKIAGEGSESWIGKRRIFTILNLTQCDISCDHSYKFETPLILGSLIRLEGGFTLPAKQALKINRVFHHQFFHSLDDIDPIVASNGLIQFFNQCLNFFNLEVKTFHTKGEMVWNYKTGGQFEIEFSEPFTLEVQEAIGLAFELRSFTPSILLMPLLGRTITFKEDRPVSFLLSCKENEEASAIFAKQQSKEYTPETAVASLVRFVFPYMKKIMGLHWDRSIRAVKIEKGHSSYWNMPILIFHAIGTVSVMPDLDLNLFMKIMENAPKETLEAFLKKDPAVQRYVLFHMFVEIIGGNLFDYTSKDIASLDLKEEVIKKIEEIKADWDFHYQVTYKLYSDSPDSLIQLLELNHEDLLKVPVDSLSEPVQRLFRAVNELTAMELSECAFLNKYSQNASYLLEKNKK